MMAWRCVVVCSSRALWRAGCGVWGVGCEGGVCCWDEAYDAVPVRPAGTSEAPVRHWRGTDEAVVLLWWMVMGGKWCVDRHGWVVSGVCCAACRARHVVRDMSCATACSTACSMSCAMAWSATTTEVLTFTQRG